MIIAILHFLHVHQVKDRTDLIPSHRSQFVRNKIPRSKINNAIRKLVQERTACYLVNGPLVWINKMCNGPGVHDVGGNNEIFIGQDLAQYHISLVR